MRKNEEEHGAMLLRYGKNILFGGIVALALCLAVLLAAAFGISRGVLSPSARFQLTVAACALGSFCGGGLAVRQCGARGLFVGVAVGGVLFLLQLTIGVLLYDSFSLDSGALGLLFSALCGGAAAGILFRGGGRRSGAREKKKRRR